MPKEPGTVSRPDPTSVGKSRRLFSNDKIKNLTKLKIQEYIQSFFDKAGSNFNLLSAISPRFINYNIDASFDPAQDPTQRRMQIARYFNRLKNILPAVLIADGGVNPVGHNIGQISNSVIVQDVWNGFYPILREIPLNIVIASQDYDEADEMSGIISLLFNEARNLAGGHHITGKREEGETWVVTLPNAPVNVSALSDMDIENDPIEKIYYAEATLEVQFEDVLAISKRLPEINEPFGVVGDSKLAVTFKPIIEVPDQISISNNMMVTIQRLQPHHKVILSDANIATLSYDNILTPRKFGKVKIQVIDSKQAPECRIISEKEIEIT